MGPQSRIRLLRAGDRIFCPIYRASKGGGMTTWKFSPQTAVQERSALAVRARIESLGFLD